MRVGFSVAERNDSYVGFSDSKKMARKEKKRDGMISVENAGIMPFETLLAENSNSFFLFLLRDV